MSCTAVLRKKVLARNFTRNFFLDSTYELYSSIEEKSVGKKFHKKFQHGQHAEMNLLFINA